MTSQPSGIPSPSESRDSGSVPCVFTSSPSARPSPSVSALRGSVPSLTSSMSLRPSASASAPSLGTYTLSVAAFEVALPFEFATVQLNCAPSSAFFTGGVAYEALAAPAMSFPSLCHW